VTGSAQQVEPCILLKLNRIFNWVPEPYDDADLAKDDPENPVPEEVKKLIRESRNQIYLNCIGENPADREVLDGNIAYFPKNQGISFRYFPYNQAGKNYHNPVVGVKFSNLPKGQLVHIECKAYYKGVEHSRKERQGLVHFEILLE
jgi:sodium/potassium-transporting ATPase subunit beta